MYVNIGVFELLVGWLGSSPCQMFVQQTTSNTCYKIWFAQSSGVDVSSLSAAAAILTTFCGSFAYFIVI